MARNWADQAQRLVKRRAQAITYRRVTRLTGPQPAVNPPSDESLLVNGVTALGATTIALRAPAVTGFLKAGDKFSIAGNAQVYTVGNQVSASNGVFSGVAISPALVAQAADGAAVTPTWAADTAIVCAALSYPLHLVDGTSIIQGDLQIVVAALDLAFDPAVGDVLIMSDGRRRKIVSVTSADPGDYTAFWSLQAR